MTTIDKIKKHISSNHLLSDNSSVIVGVSGGADSVALLDILYRLGYECILAHCNFHLRGEESNRDELFVRELLKKYDNIDAEFINFDTLAYAKQNGVSIEMAARDLRYNWFETLRIQYKATHIAVAHHQDDSIETVLLNLIRGTGIRGLTGIPIKNGDIIRPMLCVNRGEIESYLKDNAIPYVVDSTNNEDIYTRNKIRLNLIPLLESINPSAKQAISRTGEYLKQVENIYLSYIHLAKEKLLKENKIHIDELLRLDEPKAVLFEIMCEYGFNSSSVNDIFDSLDGIAGKKFYSENYLVVKDRDYLIIDKIKPASENKVIINQYDTTIAHPVRMNIETLDNSKEFVIEKNRNIVYIDKAEIKYPLAIRRWHEGDWFVPFGMRGRKKLSDYFSDHKFSLIDKENTWLLCSGDDIIWIIGHRSDNRYKITAETQKIIKISLL